MWKRLKQQTDLDELMRVFGSFHDSCLKEVAIRNREYVSSNLSMSLDNKPIVSLLFQRQFDNPTAIEVQFESVEEFNWVHFNGAYDTGLSVIYQAVLIKKNDLIYWAEDIDWNLDNLDRNDYRWLSAKYAQWRVFSPSTGADDKLVSFE